MEKETGEKLIRELREQTNDLLAAAQLLTPLVREQGDKRDEATLAALHKSLYCMVRTVEHMELCREESPSFLPRVMDLAGLCREISRKVESLSKSMEITFTWEIEKDGILALGDDFLLETAILNLISNATAAAGQGGTVSLRCKTVGDQCLILVRDDGPGYLAGSTEDDHPLIRSREGLGLGLETVRRVAALHGGTLLLENGAGDGAQAALSIPICPPEKGNILKSPPPVCDRTGGFSTLMVELAPLLPISEFGYKTLDQ